MEKKNQTLKPAAIYYYIQIKWKKLVITWSRFTRTQLQPVQMAQKFNLGKAGEFSTWYLLIFFLNFLLIFFCNHVLNDFFIPRRRAEAIAWESFVPAVQKRDPALPGWNLLLPGSRKNETDFNPGQP